MESACVRRERHEARGCSRRREPRSPRLLCREEACSVPRLYRDEKRIAAHASAVSARVCVACAAMYRDPPLCTRAHGRAQKKLASNRRYRGTSRHTRYSASGHLAPAPRPTRESADGSRPMVPPCAKKMKSYHAEQSRSGSDFVSLADFSPKNAPGATVGGDFGGVGAVRFPVRSLRHAAPGRPRGQRARVAGSVAAPVGFWGSVADRLGALAGGDPYGRAGAEPDEGGLVQSVSAAPARWSRPVMWRLT